jgi:hypothetical protein
MGKPAGVRCIQLDDNNLCRLFGDKTRPKVCLDFKATADVCGDTNTEAMRIISYLEQVT